MKDVIPGSNNKKFVLIAVPNSILLPWGSLSTYSGAFDDVAASVISDNHTNFTSIMDLIAGYKSEIGATLGDNWPAIGSFLPSLPSENLICTHPFTPNIDHLTEAEEDGSFADAVDSLQLRINRFNQQPPVPPPPAPIPVHQAANSPTTQATLTQPTPTTVVTTAQLTATPAAAPTKPISADQTDVDDILARFRLFGARLAYDSNGQPSGLILGDVHPQLDSLLRRSSKGKRARNLMAYLKTQQKSVENSYDYLLRLVHWSALNDPAVVAWVLGMTGCFTEITSVDEAQIQAEGLTSFQFTVDTRKQEKERQKTSQLAMANRNTEELLGLDDADVNRTKLGTSSYANTNIANIEALLTCGANHTFLPYALCAFDFRGDDCPTFVKALKNIIDESSGAAFRRKMEYHPQRAKFCYYVFAQFQAILRKTLNFASDPLFTQYAQSASTVSLIPTTELAEIEALELIIVADIKMFALGNRDISSTTIYESSLQFKSVYKRLHQDMGYTSTPATTEPAPKRHAGPTRTPTIPTTPKPPYTPSTNQSKSGLIIYAKPGRMPFPSIRNAATVPQLCIMHLREGLSCPFGEKCRHSHADFDSWPKSLQEDICNFVKSDEKLSFNPAVAPSHLIASS